MNVCPHCGGPLGDSDDERFSVESLRADCRELGIPIGTSGTIKPAGLSRLIDVGQGTLANWRTQGFGPRVTLIRGPRYALQDVAAWLRAQNAREDEK